MRQSRDGEIAIIDGRAGRGDGERAIWRSWTWTSALVWFMRTLAIVWLIKGLFYWSVILGANPHVGDFESLPRALQISAVLLAVGDMIAGVGLWLASPWGGVIWFALTLVETLALAFGASLTSTRTLTGGLDLVLIAAYLVVLRQAAQERP